MEVASGVGGGGTSTPYVRTGKDTVKIGDQEYRIKQVKVGGKVIDFKDLKHSEQAFREEVLHQVGETLHEYHQAGSLNQETGVYRISLTKDHTSVMDKKVGMTHSPILEKEKIQLREQRLSRMQSQANAILSKRDAQAEKLQKHSFSLHIPDHLTKVVMTIGVVVGAILLSPIFLVIGGLIHVGLALNQLSATKIDGHTLQDKADTMKSAEETAKLSGMKRCVAGLDSSKVMATFKNSDLYQDHAIMQNKATRQIEKALKREGQPPLTQNQKNQLKQLNNNDFKDTNKLKERLFEIIPKLDEVLTDKDIQRLVDESLAVREGRKTQIADMDKMNKLMDSVKNANEKDPVFANQLILDNIREVLSSPTYQALKEDPDNEFVHYVHVLNAGIWNSNTETLHAYQAFGKAIAPPSNQATVDGPGMREALDKSHETTTKELFKSNNLPQLILYGATHIKHMIGALASDVGAPQHIIAETIGMGEYDPHGSLRNNPSLQGSTEAVIGNTPVKINNCYGGSPTVGTEISPEFEAMCQAAENNQFAKIKDPNIPNVVYYTNFQNIENAHGEGARSFAIMEMNQRYPLSFVGMTLSKDSDFYLMKGKYKEPTWTSAESFGTEFLELLQNDKCYQYGSRVGTSDGGGIYLPGGKEAWNEPLKVIINQANKHFEAVGKQLIADGKGIDPAKMRGAYQEYVYSMIQAYQEMKVASDAAKTNGGKPVLIIAIRACKENIDRGGAENAKYIYTRMPLDTPANEHIALTAGTLESRALASKNRTILDKRLPQVLDFIELGDRAVFHDDMMEIFGKLGVAPNASPVFSPANKPPAGKGTTVEEIPDEHEVNISDEEGMR